MTLPEPNYTQACKLFCRILRRLEERDRKKEEMRTSVAGAIQEISASNKLSDTDATSDLDARREEEREKHD